MMTCFPNSKRRSFLKSGSLALAGSALFPGLATAQRADRNKLFSAVGIAASLEKAAMLKAAGAEFLTEGVGNFLVPDKPEADFQKNLEKLAASPLPILACNGFIRPPHLRCVGAEANHDLILEWSETTFRRMKQAGGTFIVFGSSGARQLRDGWPKEKADAQFVALLKRMGPLAEAHGIIVTIEQLREQECNYINRISEGAALIRAAGHPHVRLLADLFHMTSMGDTPADLESAMDVVVHVEIAEKEGRSVPGVSGEDFRPFFNVLRKTGYQGAVSIEGKWEDSQLAAAFAEITKQAAES
jgi:sugar phosphate isomerase/epimerase